MTMQRILTAIVAVLLLSTFTGGCDSAPANTEADVVNVDSLKGDDPVVVPASFEVFLTSTVTDGSIELAIAEPGEVLNWTKITETNFSVVTTANIGDTCVVHLRYLGEIYDQTVEITSEDMVLELDIHSAFPCAGYEDIENYAWTCEGTNIADNPNYYVENVDGQCFLKKNGAVGSNDPSIWEYHGPGSMSLAMCRNDPACWVNCTGSPL